MGEGGFSLAPDGNRKGMMSARILVVDNYDSFVFNLVQYLQQLGADTVVLRNDDVTLEQALEFDGILLSPGPGAPADAGICIDIVKSLGGQVPIFGVCLGHQAIAEAFGATVSRAPELLHGKTSLVNHEGVGVLYEFRVPSSRPATTRSPLRTPRSRLNLKSLPVPIPAW